MFVFIFLDLQCFVQKFNKIVIKNANLKAEICNDELLMNPPECTPRLLILELPENADEGHLQLIIQKVINMSTASKEFTLDRKGSKFALIINKSLSDKGMFTTGYNVLCFSCTILLIK